MSEREAFEKFMAPQGFNLERDGDRYLDIRTSHVWAGWQSRATLERAVYTIPAGALPPIEMPPGKLQVEPIGEQLKADAERYRWLREAPFRSSPTPVVVQGVYVSGKYTGDETLTGAELDETIDWARRGE